MNKEAAHKVIDIFVTFLGSSLFISKSGAVKSRYTLYTTLEAHHGSNYNEVYASYSIICNY